MNLKLNLSSTSNNDKFISKQTNEKFQNSDHIYSEDPLENKNSLQKNDDNSVIYDYIPDEMIYQQIVKPNDHIV